MAKGFFTPYDNIYNFDLRPENWGDPKQWDRESATAVGLAGGYINGIHKDYNMKFEGSAYVEFTF